MSRLTKQEWFQLRVRAAWNWLNMLEVESKGNCQDANKQKKSIQKCFSCPHFVMLEEKPNHTFICMAEFAKIGKERLNKFISD